MQPSCRFCYAYRPPVIDTVRSCSSQPCLSTIAATPSLVNHSVQTNSSVLLQATTQASIRAAQSTVQQSTIQGTIANASTITATLQSQLAALAESRYVPYQPYVPPVVPVSVMELAMKTANVGNPMPPFMKCKGSQFVTN